MAYEIAITGVGWLTPDGAGTPAEVMARCAGLAPGRFAAATFASAESDEESQQKLGPHGGFGHRLAGLAVTAGRAALRQAGPADDTVRNRLGCVLGTTFSGQTAMIGFGRQLKKSGSRFVTPLQFPETVGNYAASTVARLLDLQGPNLTVCSQMTSGLTALVEASELLESGAVDHVIAGGADVLDDELLTGLTRVRGSDPTRTAPSLAGSAYAEGACLFALERAEHARRRGAEILALIQPLYGPDAGHFDIVAVDLGEGGGRESHRRRLAGLADDAGEAAVTAPNLVWGDAFSMGSAGQVAMVLAGLYGAPVPVVSVDDSENMLPTWSVLEKATAGLAVGGPGVPPELRIAITSAGIE